jgi:hypothetical protein
MTTDLNRSSDRPKLNWSDLETFTTQGTDLAVKVQMSDGQRPQYSLEIGRIWGDKFLRFLRPEFQTTEGRVRVRSFNAEALGQLLSDAADFIEGKLQEREDAWQEQRQSRETWRTPDSAPAPRRTGKTDRTRVKRAKREQRNSDY